MSTNNSLIKKLFLLTLLFFIMIVNIASADDYYSFTPQSTAAMAFVVEEFTIDGVAAQIGDEIAVYDPQGTICGHYVVNETGNFYLDVYEDDASTQGFDEGASANDVLTFKIYDISEGNEIPELDASMFESVAIQPNPYYTIPGIETTPPQYVADKVFRGMKIKAISPPEVPMIDTIIPSVSFTAGGDTLHITGSNFEDGASLMIDDIEITLVFHSDTYVSCTIPTHEAGNVSLILSNPGGLSVTVENGLTYENCPPVITDISPESGLTIGGETVIITGEHFLDDIIIKFGANSVEEFSFSPNALTCTSPANAVAETVSVIVTNSDGKTYTLLNAYEYDLPAPEITGISPRFGNTVGGATVTITGTYFVEGASILFGDVVANSIVFESPEKLICQTPEHTVGLFNLIVQNPDGKEAVSPVQFAFIDNSPEILEIKPNKGIVEGDTEIHIYGNNFLEGAVVDIGGSDITILNLTETHITAKTPPYTSGVYDVTVTNIDGQFDKKIDGFEYLKYIAKFSFPENAPRTGYAPFHVWLENQSDGDIVEWIWHYGDGTLDSEGSFIPMIHHEYASPGVYPITLHVIGESGDDISEAQYITVTQNPCDVDVFFTSNTINSGIAPLTVSFVNETFSDTLQINSWLWDFGDGKTSTEESPTCTYTQSGLFSVQLIATTENGCTRAYFVEDFVEVVSRKISGTIINSSETGIEGVEVVLEIPDFNFVRTTTTDEDGHYTFINLPSVDFILLSAVPSDGTYFPAHLHEPISIIDGDKTDVQITCYEGGIKGTIQRCRSVHDCDRIPDVEISIFNDNGNFGVTRSDAEGNYTLTGIPEGIRYYLSAWLESTGSEFIYSSGGNLVSDFDLAKTILIGNTPIDDFILYLPSGASITGQVVRENGDPAQGIFVHAWSDRLMIGGNATTNEDGYYTITGLTEVAESENLSKYIVEIHPQGFPYQAYDHKNSPETATPVAAPMTGINFTIQTGLEIKGTVIVNSGSAQNIEVNARSKKALFETFTLTDSEGNYTLTGLPPADDYIIFALAPDYPIQFYNGQIHEVDADTVDISFGSKENINFEISKGEVIKGSVSGGSFDPSQNVIWVHVWSNSTGTGGDVPTNENGRYEIVGLNADADDYIIFIIDPQFGQAYYKDGAQNNTVYSYQELDFVDNVAQGVGPSDTDRDIVLESEFYSIRGIVTYKGLPVPGIQIEAWSEENGYWGTCLSVSRVGSNNANYEIQNLINGTYDINVISDKYIVSSNQTVTISNASVDHIDIVLSKPDRNIKGTISGLDEGSIVWVSAFSENADYGEEVMVTGTVNENTTYTIPGLKPSDDYIVHLHALDYPDIIYNAKTSWYKADKVDISKGDQSNINFTLSSDTGTISGNIRVPNGAIAGEEVWVDAFSESLRSNGAAMIKVATTCEEELGCSYPYTIKALKKGDDYIVIVNSEKYQTLFYNNQPCLNENVSFVDISSENAQGVDFSVNVGYYLSGSVVDSDQNGLSGIEVEAWSESTGLWGIDETDVDGNFTIDGLSSATDFIVQAINPGDPPYFYKSGVNHTRDIDFATEVSSVQDGSTDVKIVIVSGYNISGVVKDNTGKGVSGIIVSAVSQTQNFENHSKTDGYGVFTIKGLPGNSTYIVSVEPRPDQTYIRQEKNATIDDSNIEVNFSLTTGYEVSGVVWNASFVPIAEAGVFLRSDATGYEEWVGTNMDGEYSFKGVPTGSDYDMVVETTEDYLLYIENDIPVTGNLNSKNISLTPAAGKIRGYVYKNDGQTPIANVSIFVYSDSTDFQSFDTYTNYKGYYEVNGLPQASDYIITAVPDYSSAYAEDSISNRSPGDIVNFSLAVGGSIKGVVKTSSGTTLENVFVTLTSASLNVQDKNTRTDSNGNYIFSGLKNSPTSDYVVTVYPESKGYPVTDRTGINIGDPVSVDFNLTKGNLTTISGTVSINGEIPGSAVRVYLYNAELIRIAIANMDTSGSFEFTTLESTGQYILRFLSRDRTLNHYASKDGNSVTSINDAGAFGTGTIVNFEHTTSK
jgi:PKD repeat protein